MEMVFTVHIKSSHPDEQKRGTLEEEAENIKDCILDGMGYPLSLDTGQLTIDVVCNSITHTTHVPDEKGIYKKHVTATI